MTESATPEEGKRKYREGSVYYRKDRGTWTASKIVGHDINGKPIRISASGETRAKALAARDRKERAYKHSAAKTRNRGTLGEYLDRWLTNIISQEVKPTTTASYSSSIRNQIKPTIGNKKLERITPEDVRQMRRMIEESYAERAKKEDKPKLIETGVSRARYAQVVLSKALADAVREGLLDRNVAHSAFVKKAPLPDKEQPALNAEQAKRLIRVALERRDRWAARWAIALLMGVRQSEVLGLTWDRVDFNRKEILFSKQLQIIPNEHGCGPQDKSTGMWPCGFRVPRSCPERRYKLTPQQRARITFLEEGESSLALTPTKSKMSKRAIPMSKPLEQMLRAHKLETSSEPNPHNLVFHHEDGRPLYPREDYDNWHAALDAAGLERIKLHATRHSTASILSDLGVDREVIKQILGHTNLETTARYASVGEVFKREALESLGELVGLFSDDSPPALSSD